MDAVKFIKESKRLCKAQESCEKCVVKIGGCCLTDIFVEENSAEKTVAVVEQWAKYHPAKTRQSEFLKMFPNANLKNITRLLPCSIDSNMKPLRCDKYGYLSITCRCDRCRDDYWNEEVSE